MITVEFAAYAYATEHYNGWCCGCGDWTREMTEPDAERYQCPECEGLTVYGAEQALLMGLIELGREP